MIVKARITQLNMSIVEYDGDKPTSFQIITRVKAEDSCHIDKELLGDCFIAIFPCGTKDLDDFRFEMLRAALASEEAPSKRGRNANK